MASRWTVVDTQAQAELIASSAPDQQTTSVLTTSAVAYHTLTTHGVPAISHHNFLTYAGQNDLATHNVAVAGQLCQTLDTALHTRAPALPAAFRPFDALLYQLKHLLDALSFGHAELDTFIEREQPDELGYWPLPEQHNNGARSMTGGSSYQPFLWPATDSIWAALLNNQAWQDAHAVVATPLPPVGGPLPTDGRTRPGIDRTLKAWFNPNRITALAQIGYRGGWSGRAAASPLTVLTKGDDILAFVDNAMSQRGVTALDWWTEWDADPVSVRSGRTIRLPLRPNDALPGPALSSLHEIVPDIIARTIPPALVDILTTRLARFCAARVPSLLALYQRALAYCETRRPRALLCGTITSDTAHVIGQAARSADTPLVSFQHGGVYGYARTLQLSRSDLKAPHFFCSYGPGVTDTLQAQAQADHLPVRVITTGWDRQGRVSGFRFGKRRAAAQPSAETLSPAGKPVLMYVPTSLIGNTRYGPLHRYVDTAYYLHQIELAHALAAVGAFHIVFKLHYKDRVRNPIPDYLARNGLSHIQVVQQQPLSALLPQADIVLLDWPSTTLLEALAVNRRVIYLDRGVLEWTESGRRLMANSAWWIVKQAGWQAELQHAVQTESWPYRGGPAFLDAYGSAEYTPEHLWMMLDEQRTPQPSG